VSLLAKVGIFGSGTVWLTSGVGFRELENEGMFYEIDRVRVRGLLDRGFFARAGG